LKDAMTSSEVVVGDTFSPRVDTIHLRDDAFHRAAGIVAYLQRQEWIGNVFVRDDGPAAGLPGTLPLSLLWGGHLHRRGPHIQYSAGRSDGATAAGFPGTSAGTGIASHGTTSPYDMRHTLIAAGPDFRARLESDLPC